LRYAAPVVVLAEALPLVVAFVVALDNVLIALLPALVTLLVVLRLPVLEPAADDNVPVLLVVIAGALLDVPDVAIGNCCSITSTYVGPPTPLAPVMLVVLPVVADANDELLLTLPAVPEPFNVAALPSSTNNTVAPLLSMPMKLPTRGVFVPEIAEPLAVLAVLVCALLARALVPGALKLPVQPCPPSVSL